MNEGCLNWSELWAGAVEAQYQKPTVTSSELRRLSGHAAARCLYMFESCHLLVGDGGMLRRKKSVIPSHSSRLLISF